MFEGDSCALGRVVVVGVGRGHLWEESTITAEYFTPSQEALTERMISAEEGKFNYEKEIREGLRK